MSKKNIKLHFRITSILFIWCNLWYDDNLLIYSHFKNFKYFTTIITKSKINNEHIFFIKLIVALLLSSRHFAFITEKTLS